MPKLPKNLVSGPPAFDNPLRRTTPADTEIAEAAVPNHHPDVGEAKSEQGGVVIPFASNVPIASDVASDIEAAGIVQATGIVQAASDLETTSRARKGRASKVRPESHPNPNPMAPDDIIHRITVRIDDATRCALEAECHRRRIAGQKTNVAEIARAILAQWTSRR